MVFMCLKSRGCLTALLLVREGEEDQSETLALVWRLVTNGTSGAKDNRLSGGRELSSVEALVLPDGWRR